MSGILNLPDEWHLISNVFIYSSMQFVKKENGFFYLFIFFISYNSFLLQYFLTAGGCLKRSYLDFTVDHHKTTGTSGPDTVHLTVLVP